MPPAYVTYVTTDVQYVTSVVEVGARPRNVSIREVTVNTWLVALATGEMGQGTGAVTPSTG